MHRHLVLICDELDLLLEKIPFNIGRAYPIVKEICDLTANNYSSMYKDWQNKNPTEIDYINGYIIKTCEKFSIPCPHNQALVNQVKQLTLGA